MPCVKFWRPSTSLTANQGIIGETSPTRCSRYFSGIYPKQIGKTSAKRRYRRISEYMMLKEMINNHRKFWRVTWYKKWKFLHACLPCRMPQQQQQQQHFLIYFWSRKTEEGTVVVPKHVSFHHGNVINFFAFPFTTRPHKDTIPKNFFFFLKHNVDKR